MKTVAADAAQDAALQLKIRDIEVVGAGVTLMARVYTAVTPALPGVKRDGLIVFFPGGGFVKGGLEEADDFLRCLVQGNPDHIVLASGYTLATDRPFPAAVEDAHAVLLWAKKNKAKLGWTGKRMMTAGIEAGANLAAVSSMMSRDRGGPPLVGQILIMPMLDPGLSTCSMREMPAHADQAMAAANCAASYSDYLPNASDRTHPYASPLLSSRLKNLPPALILSGEEDPLRDEAEQYGAKLIGCGIKTTVRRLPPNPVADVEARNECACKVHALNEINSFITVLDMESPIT